MGRRQEWAAKRTSEATQGVALLVGALLRELNGVVELDADAAVRHGRCEAREWLAQKVMPCSRLLYSLFSALGFLLRPLLLPRRHLVGVHCRRGGLLLLFVALVDSISRYLVLPFLSRPGG